MQRLRRLRHSAAMRDLVAETQVRTGALVYPIFVMDGENIEEEVPSMPGVFRYSVDREGGRQEYAAFDVQRAVVYGVARVTEWVGNESGRDDQ